MANILVVEDELGMREWLTEILEGASHRVFAAEDGVKARSLATLHSLDLVITDISMPNEDGLGTIRALHKAFPALKIIVMSGKDPESLMDAKLLGAHAALRKPVSAKVVLECVGGLSPI